MFQIFSVNTTGRSKFWSISSLAKKLHHEDTDTTITSTKRSGENVQEYSKSIIKKNVEPGAESRSFLKPGTPLTPLRGLQTETAGWFYTRQRHV